MFRIEGWDTSCPFRKEAELCDRKVIVKMRRTCTGYWDLEFEDGTRLDAVHTLHIIPIL